MRASVLFLSSALALGALPALADVHQLGAVNVSADNFTVVSWSRFDGPVQKLTFIPETDAVDCSHITINYRDGTTHDVFHGRLVKDSVQTITFPESDDRRIRSVDFACKAENVDGARIALSAVSDGQFPEDHINRPTHTRTYQDAGAGGR